MPTMKKRWRHALKAVQRSAKSRPLPPSCPRCKIPIPALELGQPQGLVALVGSSKAPVRPAVFLRACPGCAWFPGLEE